MATKKNIKVSIGDLRSIQQNLELLYARLSTINRENGLTELETTMESFRNTRDELANVVFEFENILHKD